MLLNKLICIQDGAVHRYGPGGVCWVGAVGDLSAMYYEVDPVLACDKTEFALFCLPECNQSGQAGGFVSG